MIERRALALSTCYRVCIRFGSAVFQTALRVRTSLWYLFVCIIALHFPASVPRAHAAGPRVTMQHALAPICDTFERVREKMPRGRCTFLYLFPSCFVAPFCISSHLVSTGRRARVNDKTQSKGQQLAVRRNFPAVARFCISSHLVLARCRANAPIVRLI